MRLGLSVATGCLVRAGQAAACAGLLVQVAGSLGQAERCSVVGKSLAGLPDSEGDFAEAVGCLGCAGRVTAAPEQG
jgi:hypothetical protein